MYVSSLKNKNFVGNMVYYFLLKANKNGIFLNQQNIIIGR